MGQITISLQESLGLFRSNFLSIISYIIVLKLLIFCFNVISKNIYTNAHVLSISCAH